MSDEVALMPVVAGGDNRLRVLRSANRLRFRVHLRRNQFVISADCQAVWMVQHASEWLHDDTDLHVHKIHCTGFDSVPRFQSVVHIDNARYVCVDLLRLNASF